MTDTVDKAKATHDTAIDMQALKVAECTQEFLRMPSAFNYQQLQNAMLFYQQITLSEHDDIGYLPDIAVSGRITYKKESVPTHSPYPQSKTPALDKFMGSLFSPAVGYPESNVM